MRLVIDTNVLISHLFWPYSRIGILVDGLLEYHDVLRSVETFSELIHVVKRRKFDRYLPIGHL